MDLATKNGMDGLRALPTHALTTGDGRRPSLAAALAGSALHFLFRMLACRRAAIGPMTALMLIPISGAIAYSVELGCWHYMQRAMQNAADTAALAAATNNNSSLVGTDPYYRVEARAAAKRFGFTDGGNTAITSDRVNCPAGTASGVTCYSATVTTKFPLMFSRVVGFNGDSAFGSGRGQSILATAIATTAGGSSGLLTTPCVSTVYSLTTKGTPKADLTGCTVLSYGTMDCKGHGVKADYAVGPTPDPNCPQNSSNAVTVGGSSGATLPPDPYASLESKIPANDASCPTSTLKTGSPSATCLYYPGGLTLSGDYTITKANTVIVVGGTGLDMNSKVLSTSGNGSATIIFTGSGSGLTAASNKNGIINIQAPSSGNWAGVAIYQDPTPKLTQANLIQTTISGAKANQAWTITGLVYLPNSDVTISGAVNHFAGAPTCMVLFVGVLQVNGDGSLLQAPTGCNVSGTTTTSVQVTPSTLTRQKLVQ